MQECQTQQNELVEEYKQMIDYPDYYISNYGNVKKIINGKESQVSILTNGKQAVIQMRVNKKVTNLSLPRLVYKHFSNDFQPICGVYNKDKNKFNNRIDNLYQIKLNDEIKKHNFQKKEFYGVCYVEKVNMYKVQIFQGKKIVCFGYRRKIMDAFKLYNESIIKNNLQDKYKLNDIEKLEKIFNQN